MILINKIFLRNYKSIGGLNFLEINHDLPVRPNRTQPILLFRIFGKFRHHLAILIGSRQNYNKKINQLSFKNFLNLP